MKLNLIAAIDDKGSLGYQNKIQWHCRGDMKFFKTCTKGNCVFMGRKTFESLDSKPLHGRLNIVLSSLYKNDINIISDELIFIRSHELLSSAVKNNLRYSDEVWISGGKTLYDYYMRHEYLLDNIYITQIKGSYKSDTYCELLLKRLKSMKEVEDFYNEDDYCGTLYHNKL